MALIPSSVTPRFAAEGKTWDATDTSGTSTLFIKTLHFIYYKMLITYYMYVTTACSHEPHKSSKSHASISIFANKHVLNHIHGSHQSQVT